MTVNFPDLIIRADAFNEIGTGHVMRCLALAQAWQLRGGKVAFISHCRSESLRERIEYEHIDFIPVEGVHPDFSDLSVMLRILERYHFDDRIPLWLVIDGYHFNQDYFGTLRQPGHQTLIIDDYNHYPYYPADIILNQNISADTFPYSCDPGTSLLLGPQYVLLRREFWPWRNWTRVVPDQAKRILVTLGGSDTRNVTLKVIRELGKIRNAEIEVTVVLGSTNVHHEVVGRELCHGPFPFRLLRSVHDMPDLMAWADIAIASAGSTSWELAFMGLPTLLVTAQESHAAQARQLERVLSYPTCNIVSESDEYCISEIVSELLCARTDRMTQSEKGKALIDGYGVDRVISQMMNECGMA